MKNDVISRSAAVKALENIVLKVGKDKVRTVARCVNEIELLPALDAVPVVRCLACSWRIKTSFCRRHGHYVRDDFFCAYGTTGDVRGCRPAKKIEKKAEERCLATGGPCSRCTPGPCDHRKTVIADDSGQ